MERETANAMKTVWPEARRGLVQARSAKEGPDVEGTPYWVEAKVGKRVNIMAAMRQADAAREEDKEKRPALVVSRADGEKSLVTMTLLEFLALAKRAYPDVAASAVDVVA
jgi:hypothetical protein